MAVTNLNLSSEPFRNRALPWSVAISVTIISFVALVFIAKWTMQTNAQTQIAERDVTQLRKQTTELSDKIGQIKNTLSPEDQKMLKSAHTLVDRKRFSWARLFEDLEGALPGAVRVQRIAVKGVAMEGDRTVADLELTRVRPKKPHFRRFVTMRVNARNRIWGGSGSCSTKAVLARRF